MRRACMSERDLWEDLRAKGVRHLEQMAQARELLRLRTFSPSRRLATVREP
jgi:hypothetical protein